MTATRKGQGLVVCKVIKVAEDLSLKLVVTQDVHGRVTLWPALGEQLPGFLPACSIQPKGRHKGQSLVEQRSEDPERKIMLAGILVVIIYSFFY